MRMGELGCPEGNPGRNTQRMRGESILEEHTLPRQTLHGRGFAKIIAVEMTRGGFLLICHNHQNVRFIRHSFILL
jgi:hypothetical protein